jgi:hypothetical protein
MMAFLAEIKELRVDGGVSNGTSQIWLPEAQRDQIRRVELGLLWSSMVLRG